MRMAGIISLCRLHTDRRACAITLFSVQADAQVLWESVEYAYTVTKIGITVEEGGISGDDEHIFIIEKIAARISDLYEDAEVTVQ